MSGLFGRFKLASGQSTSSLPDNKKGAGSPTNTGSKSVANLFSRKGSNDSSVDKPAVDETNADHSGASIEELQKEISKLQHTIKKYKAELDEQKRRVSEQTALNDETKQLLTASEQLEEELQKEVAALQAQLNKSLGDQEQARAEATQAVEKLRVAEKRASDTEKRLEEANAQYVAAAKVALEVTQLKAQLQTSELAKQEYEKQLHELSVEYTDFRKQVDTLAQKGDVNGIPVLLRQGTKAFIKTEEKKADAKRRCCGAGGGKDEGGCSVM